MTTGKKNPWQQKLQGKYSENLKDFGIIGNKVSMFFVLIMAIAWDVFQEIAAEAQGFRQRVLQVGPNRYVQITGTVDLVLGKLAELADPGAVKVLTVNKYDPSGLATLIYLESGDARVTFPAELLKSVLQGNCYANVYQLFAAKNGRRFAANALDESLATQHVQEFFGEANRIMSGYNKDAVTKPGKHVHNLLVLVDPKRITRTTATHYGDDIDTCKVAVLNPEGNPVRNTIGNEMLFQIDLTTGMLYAISVDAFVESIAVSGVIAWKPAGKIEGKVLDIAAVSQHDGSLALIATIDKGSMIELAPYTIKDDGSRIMATLNTKMVTSIPVAEMNGTFVGFSEEGRAAFLDREGDEALTILPTAQFKGLANFGPWTDAATTAAQRTGTQQLQA